MLRRFISLSTIGVLIRLVVAQLEGVKVDERPLSRHVGRPHRRTSYFYLVTTKEPKVSTTHISENATVVLRHGSACRERNDCPSTLVCLSGTCKCPERLPVLLRFDKSFACAPSRRLDERCLSDAECNHANENARCLRSVCSCPPRFYVTKASLLCLPESAAWHPMRRFAIYPALALLVSAFLTLGGVCYDKLFRRRRRFRARMPRHVLPTATRELRYERFLKCLEDRSICKRLPHVSTTFRFGTDYSYTEVHRRALGRGTETSELYQPERVAVTALHWKCSAELERKESECGSSSVSIVCSNAETRSIASESFSPLTNRNLSTSGLHCGRPESGNTGERTDSSGSVPRTGTRHSCGSRSRLSRTSASEIQLEENTGPISQFPQLSESGPVTDKATAVVNDFVPSHFSATALVTKGRPVPLPRTKIPVVLTYTENAVIRRSRLANSRGSVFAGAAITSPGLRGRHKYEKFVHNETTYATHRLSSDYREARIANLKRLRRAMPLDFRKRRLINMSDDELSAETSRRSLASVSELQLKPDRTASWPLMGDRSCFCKLPAWEDRVTAMCDPPAAQSHSVAAPLPTSSLRLRSQRVQSVVSSNRAVSIAAIPVTAEAPASRLNTSAPHVNVGESRSLDSALAAAALVAVKGSSFHSFSFTRSDCSNLPISLRSGVLQSDDVESLPWPSRIKP